MTHTDQPTRPHWHKSSYSGDEGGECIEVAVDHAAVRIRDSKQHTGPHLAITPGTWAEFVAHIGRTQ